MFRRLKDNLVAYGSFAKVKKIKLPEQNKENLVMQSVVETPQLLSQAAVAEFNQDREQLRQESKKQVLKVQEENRRHYNLRRRTSKSYKIGDLVAIKRTQFGPYEVLKIKGIDRYDVIKVGDHEGPLRACTCSEFMKAWLDVESEADSGSDGRV
ncbi:hypothetical protein HUJ04_005986 [Dendroctonus ponderosae]|nr:hypothetical protein HUJ04_005986 [Dendroctonus ponderosae]